MTIRRPIVIGLVSLTLICMYSCSKQDGCIDPNAVNYTYEAKKNDGSCVYHMSFWMNTVQHGYVEIFVDEIYKGYLDCGWPSDRPTCGNDTLLNTGYKCVNNVALSPGNHFVRIEAEDQTIWEETYLLEENCLSILITD